MNHNTYERGPKLLAVIGFGIIVLTAFTCVVLSLAVWLFKRPGLLLVLTCLGCSECRINIQHKTLFNEVSLCMEMVR